MTRARGGNLVRLAFDGPGATAGWHAEHHALAQLLSTGQSLAVHAYAVEPYEYELVVAYADGRRVGGERVRYDEVEVSDEEALDDALFAKLQSRWPLGHLAQVVGLTRQELLALRRHPALQRIELPGR
jgi:hypothetical protein